MPASSIIISSPKSILQSLLKLAIPIMGVQLLQTGYQITDAYWVGKLGSNAVAAVSVNFPISFLFLSLSSGFAVAGGILVAQYFGAGKKTMVDHVATQMLMMVLLVSIGLTVISLCFSSSILSLIGVGNDIFQNALLFLRINLIGIPVTFVFIMFQAVMRGVGKVTMPLIINIVTVVLNFVLDPLFIYGWGPLSGHGVAGAAIATLITQVLSAIVALVILFNGKEGIQINWRGLAPDWPLIRKSFKLGLPSSIEFSLRSLALSAMFVLVTPYGTNILAVYGIGVRLATLVVIPALGLSMACSTLVGQNIGAGRWDIAEKISRLSVLIGVLLLSGIGAVCYFSAPLIVGFFITGNSYVTKESIRFIHIVSLFYGFLGIQQSLRGTFKGAGDTMKSMYSSILNGWIIQIPSALIMSRYFSLGFIGIWLSLPLSDAITTIVTLFWYNKGDWKHKKLISMDLKPINNEKAEIYQS